MRVLKWVPRRNCLLLYTRGRSEYSHNNKTWLKYEYDGGDIVKYMKKLMSKGEYNKPIKLPTYWELLK